MKLFAVFNGRGPEWNFSRPLREQKGWREHAAFMNSLVDDGFVVLGGPLGDGESVLLIVKARDEQEIRARLSRDPWATGLRPIAKIKPWEILLGELPT